MNRVEWSDAPGPSPVDDKPPRPASGSADTMVAMRLMKAAPHLHEALRMLDERLRLCMEMPCTTVADAYDSFYQEEVAAALREASTDQLGEL